MRGTRFDGEFDAGGRPELPMREEAPHVRLDRNLAELLAELRVTLTGVQILFAFLLVLPFQARFTELSGFERGLYATTLTTSALASVALLAPVAFHRVVFRRNRKDSVVGFAHVMALLGLGLLSGCIVSGVWLALSVADVPVALGIAVGLGAVLTPLWWLVPVVVRVRQRGTPAQTVRDG